MAIISLTEHPSFRMILVANVETGSPCPRLGVDLPGQNGHGEPVPTSNFTSEVCTNYSLSPRFPCR